MRWDFLRLAPIAALIFALSACAAAQGLAGASTHTFAPVAAQANSSADPAAPSSAARDAGPLVIVGLGDSVTAGDGCDCIGFVDRLAANVQSTLSRTVTSINDGEGGLTAAGLDDRLTSDDDLVADVAKADFVVVTIGANDVGPLRDRFDADGCPSSCVAPAVDEVASHTASLLDKVRGIAPSAHIAVTSYWNDFPDGQAEPDAMARSWTDGVTTALNAALRQVSSTAGATYVDLYAPFKGDGTRDPSPLLGDDGDHPNAEGHAVIAAALDAWVVNTLDDSHSGVGAHNNDPNHTGE